MPVHSFLPSPSAYTHALQVSASDIDALGHANNVAWVRWVNEAAIAHAEHAGWGMHVCRDLGLVWLVRRHDIEYLLPAFAGDRVHVHTWPESMRAATSVRRSVFVRGAEVLARAETTWVLVELDSKKPRRVPAAMLSSYGFAAAAARRSAAP